MTVAEGLELKELRETLDSALCMLTEGADPQLMEAGIRPCEMAEKILLNALSRDKTSYKTEAQLVENVVSAAKSLQEWKPSWDEDFIIYQAGLTLALKALDEFRAKK